MIKSLINRLVVYARLTVEKKKRPARLAIKSFVTFVTWCSYETQKDLFETVK